MDYIEALVKNRSAGEPRHIRMPELLKRVEDLRAFMKPLGIDGAPGISLAQTLGYQNADHARVAEAARDLRSDRRRLPATRRSEFPGVPAVLSSKPVSGNRSISPSGWWILPIR